MYILYKCQNTTDFEVKKYVRGEIIKFTLLLMTCIHQYEQIKGNGWGWRDLYQNSSPYPNPRAVHKS